MRYIGFDKHLWEYRQISKASIRSVTHMSFACIKAQYINLNIYGWVTKYYFYKDGLGAGNDLEYTISYYLEFNFTNWGDYLGMDFLNAR